MKKLDGHEIAQAYEDKAINLEKLLKFFNEKGKFNNHDHYIAYCEQFTEDECSLFNITPTIKEFWVYHGIELRIYINLDDNKVYNCAISKYKEVGGYHGRPSGHGLKPSQQELRIFRRIMDYITRS